MTILAGGSPQPSAQPPAPGTNPEPSHAQRPEPGRFTRWRTSWRLALRMARRDVRRNKGRTALAFAMIFLPTMLLSATVVLVSTADLSGARGIPYRLGDATAKASYQGYKVAQDPDPGAYATAWAQDAATAEAQAQAIADGAEEEDPPKTPPMAEQKSALEAATGGTAYAFLELPIRFQVGTRARTDQAWIYDPTKITGRASLITGRWPTRPDEAVVTDYGLTRGLASTGSITLTFDAPDYNPSQTAERPKRTLTVVGVARARASGLDGATVPAAIAQPLESDLTKAFATSTSYWADWFVMGGRPLAWKDVKKLNDEGYVVTSRSVLKHPPPAGERYQANPEYGPEESSTTRTIQLFGYAFMAVVVALLVAPAFAVSAARSRRTLALAASNGATTKDLRRTVLGQALVIGIAATSTSAVLGVLGVWVGGLIASRLAGYEQLPPVALPWGSMLAMIAIGLLSAIVAALIPANRLGRLDIVSVMRGQVAAPRPSLVVFWLGLIVTLTSAVLLLGALVTMNFTTDPGGITNRQAVAAVTGLTLIAGSVFLVPMALAGLSRVGGILPTAGSMAARDMGRHRGRSAPTVAAVLAAAAALTLGLILQESDAANRDRSYTPSALVGEGTLSYYYSGQKPDADSVRALNQLKAAHPDLVFTQASTFGENDSPNETGWSQDWLRVIPSGCTPAEAETNPEYERAVEAFDTKYPSGPPRGVDYPVNRCAFDAVHRTTREGQDPVTLAMPAAWLIERLGLNDEQARALRAGGLIYAVPKTASLPTGDVKIAWGTTTNSDSGESQVNVKREWSDPLIVVPAGGRTTGALLGAGRAIAVDGPTAKDLPTKVGSDGGLTHVVTTVDGSAVTADQAEALTSDLGDAGYFRVETGHEDNPLKVITYIVLGLFAFLVLLVVLTTTALSLAEQQRDQATLAAVGATRGTRRVMAGVQAFLIAATGAVGGLLVGVVPALGLSYAILAPPSDSSSDGAFVASNSPGAVSSLATVVGDLTMPWLSLAIMAFGIPLVAGIVAALGIRKAPSVGRRAT